MIVNQLKTESVNCIQLVTNFLTIVNNLRRRLAHHFMVLFPSLSECDYLSLTSDCFSLPLLLPPFYPHRSFIYSSSYHTNGQLCTIHKIIGYKDGPKNYQQKEGKWRDWLFFEHTINEKPKTRDLKEVQTLAFCFLFLPPFICIWKFEHHYEWWPKARKLRFVVVVFSKSLTNHLRLLKSPPNSHSLKNSSY